MNNKLSILSYNIWFNEFNRTERLFSLFDNIKHYDPDIICLQEVLPIYYDTIKNNLEYPYSYPKKIISKYDCVILSKHPIEKFISIKLKSNMNRKMLILLINYSGTQIIISNVHFESEFDILNQLKLSQFKHVSVILKKLCLDYDNVILCSDTNVMQSEENIFDDLFNNMYDSWKQNGCDESNKFTYDYLTNFNLQSRNIKLQGRIDKILYKLTNFKLHEFKLIQGLTNTIQPSDHHGIISIFEFI